MRNLRLRIAAACLLLGGVSGPPASAAELTRATPTPSKANRDALALADTIDRQLAAKWAEAKVRPAPPADDAEFLRRVYLDLVGKIPSTREARDFIDDQRPDKRRRLVESLLDGPAYLVNATEIYRSLLLPEADTDAQVSFLAPTFEAWLRKKVSENVGYDQIVREILTLRLGGRNNRRPTNGQAAEATPIAFYEAKQGKPENLAAGTTRVFLGLRLECAQCHNHPFARWKREEFWGVAAFFAGVGRQGGPDGFGAIREMAGRRDVTIPGTEKKVTPAFLNGKPPKLTGRAEPRAVLAAWITADNNPYFARAAVNRVWARFFGTGLVDPVDDMNDDNPPSHPELLDALASQFRSHKYDLKFLIRAITSSQAYGMTSGVGRSELASPTLFAAMPVRGMSPGQLFDSLARATGVEEGSGQYMGDIGNAKTQFLELFANRDEKPTESQTSILQALAMMNGNLIAGATSLQYGATLGGLAEAPFLDTPGRIEALYLAALTRQPRPEELKPLIAYVDGGGPTKDHDKALADVFWAILNSPEFKLNH